jgi:hypothetical protein
MWRLGVFSIVRASRVLAPIPSRAPRRSDPSRPDKTQGSSCNVHLISRRLGAAPRPHRDANAYRSRPCGRQCRIGMHVAFLSITLDNPGAKRRLACGEVVAVGYRLDGAKGGTSLHSPRSCGMCRNAGTAARGQEERIQGQADPDLLPYGWPSPSWKRRIGPLARPIGHIAIPTQAGGALLNTVRVSSERRCDINAAAA